MVIPIKINPEILLSEYGLVKNELTAMSLMAIVPYITPKTFVETEESFGLVSGRNFCSVISHLLEDNWVTDNANYELFMKRDLKNTIVDTLDEATFAKQLEFLISVFGEIPSTTIQEEAILRYCKALKYLVDRKEEFELLTLTNSEIIRKLDTILFKKEGNVLSKIKELIDDESWEFLRRVLCHPFLGLVE